MSRLQEWLSTLTPYLPGDSAAIVSVSIGRWSDLVSTNFDPNTPGDLSRFQAPKLRDLRRLRVPRPEDRRRFQAPSKLEVAPELVNALLPQGDASINLLVGAESPHGLLTPEGLVVAAEAALGRTARIVNRIVAHYWFALLILAIAVAGALYAAATYMGGAGRVGRRSPPCPAPSG